MILSFLISVLLSFFLWINPAGIIPEKVYNYKADFFSTDGLRNLYIVQNSQLVKINTDNNKKLVYSNSSLGEISIIDPSDPFRILVFYKDFNKIVFLDKNLTEITSPVILDDTEYYNVLSVCQSINGGFWVLDQNSGQLLYFNKSLNILKKSSVIPEIYDQNTEGIQAFILEKNDYIYVGIENAGILQFDNYGVYIKSFPIANSVEFQVVDNVIIYYKEDKLNYYNTKNYTEESIKLPVENTVRSAIEGSRLFIQTEKKILVYNLNKLKELE